MPDLPIKTNWQFKEKFSQMKLTLKYFWPHIYNLYA